jgi:hypothetical protein
MVLYTYNPSYSTVEMGGSQTEVDLGKNGDPT